MTNRTPWAEWNAHTATIMYWPVRKAIWPRGLAIAEEAYLKVIHAIATFEPVILIVPEGQANRIRHRVSDQVIVIEHTLDDSWARDTAPMFTWQDGQLIAHCWQFNAWGEKFHPYVHDAQASIFMAKWLQACAPDAMVIEQHDWVLEGGAVHTNGQNYLLITEECLLNPNRNGITTKDEVEAKLKEAFGATHLLWLPFGLEGDLDTDGHIDNVACFIDPKTLLMQRPSRDDPDWLRFEKNMHVIQQWQAQGHSIELVLIDLPEPIFQDGVKVPRSYVNFAWANNAIVMPSFDCPQDDVAYDFFRQYFPTREIIQVPANEIVAGGGGIHCITMPIPYHGPLAEAIGGLLS